MEEAVSLGIAYASHARVQELRERLREYVEGIALGFDRWGEDRIFGPGAYIAIVAGPTLSDYADPMGGNRWPADAPRDLFDDPDGFYEALESVSFSCDGALVVAVDGVVVPQFVRFRDVDTAEGMPYADWMGARHMSALDVSTRDDVVATVTLSQASGRVTVFEDGTYESTERTMLGAPWRTEDS